LPSSSIFPAADLAADRRFYLPMLAFATLAGCLLRNLNRRAVLIPLAAGLAVLSLFRTQVWATEAALWSEAVERGPNKLRPYLQLARASEPQAALPILDKAQSVAPLDPRPAVEKGLKYMALNRPELAAAEFERALALAPNDPDTLNNRGVALSLMGERSRAIADFRRALTIDPCRAAARRNLERLGERHPVPCSDTE
jgi:tetratricopeptide (TPR) repeat protein